MIFGIGIDIEDPERFRKYLFTDAKPLPVFTPEELENYMPFENHLCLAFSFGFKESVFKALGGIRPNSFLNWTEAELFFGAAPAQKKIRYRFSGEVLKRIEENGISARPETEFYLKDDFSVFETVFHFQ